MIGDILLATLNFFATVGRQLGWAGTLFALLALFAMGALMRFVDRCLSVWDKAERRWRRWPTPVRHFFLTLAALFVLMGVGPMIPWTPALVALVFGLAAAWWTQGLQYARRYQVRQGPVAAWRYHLRSKADGAGMVDVAEKSTGKKNARCLRCTPTENGKEAVMMPPDGQSLSDYTAEVNDGKHTAAMARRFGLKVVKGVSAVPQRDGTALVRMTSHTDRPDPLREGRDWKPAL